jgi:hypothetical protein
MPLGDILLTVDNLLTVDDSYLYEEDTNSKSYLLNLSNRYLLLSKGFYLSNSSLFSNIYLGIDKQNNRWTAEIQDDNPKKPILFYLNRTDSGKGLLFSSRTFTREEFEEIF